MSLILGLRYVHQQSAGRNKTPFCVLEDELLSALDELLRETGQAHHMVRSHNELNVAKVASCVSMFFLKLCYRQRCTKRKLPVFKLLRGRFWGFSSRRGDTLHRWGEIWHGGRDLMSPPPCQISPPSAQRQGCRTPKLKFLLRFDQNMEYKTPRMGVSLARFSQNLQNLYPISGCVRC